MTVPAPEITERSLALAARHRGVWDVGLTLSVALFLMVPGLFAPFLTLKTLIVFERTASLYTAFLSLFREGENILALTVLLFSVLFPLSKLILLACVWYGEAISAARKETLLLWIHGLSKFSMTEIFVAAIAVSILKIGAFGEAEVGSGVYFLLLSVVLGLYASTRVSMLIDRPFPLWRGIQRLRGGEKEGHQPDSS